MLAILAQVVIGMAVPAAGSAKQLDCLHPAIAPAVSAPAVVGIPWRVPAATFWCLETGDQLVDAAISWGDGTVTPGDVSYSKPERSTVIVPAVLKPGSMIEPVTIKTGMIGGSHVYARVPRGGARITVAATDLSTGTAFTSSAGALVLPRDLAGPIALHTSDDVLAGPIAHVRVPDFEYARRLRAGIEWGDGQRSDGTIVEPLHKIDAGTQLYTIRGRHRWGHAGVHTITVHITDEIGPQHLVVRDHVLLGRLEAFADASHASRDANIAA